MLISQSDTLTGNTSNIQVQYREGERNALKDSMETKRVKVSGKPDTKKLKKTPVNKKVGVAFSVSLIILVFLIVVVVWMRRWYYVYYR